MKDCRQCDSDRGPYGMYTCTSRLQDGIRGMSQGSEERLGPGGSQDPWFLGKFGLAPQVDKAAGNKRGGGERTSVIKWTHAHCTIYYSLHFTRSLAKQVWLKYKAFHNCEYIRQENLNLAEQEKHRNDAVIKNFQANKIRGKVEDRSSISQLLNLYSK